MSQQVNIHESNLFSYLKKEEKENQTNFLDCILLQDIIDEGNENVVRVSAHDETICIKGTKIDCISYSNAELYGWIGDDIVLDVIWEPKE